MLFALFFQLRVIQRVKIWIIIHIYLKFKTSIAVRHINNRVKWILSWCMPNNIRQFSEFSWYENYRLFRYIRNARLQTTFISVLVLNTKRVGLLRINDIARLMIMASRDISLRKLSQSLSSWCSFNALLLKKIAKQDALLRSKKFNLHIFQYT